MHVKCVRMCLQNVLYALQLEGVYEYVSFPRQVPDCLIRHISIYVLLMEILYHRAGSAGSQLIIQSFLLASTFPFTGSFSGRRLS